jgi:uncharacterized protein YjhX (UPF0386 family)
MASKREVDQLKGAVRFVRAKRLRLRESQERELRSRTWAYDRAGNLTESSYYDSRGVLQGNLRWQYDGEGREIELIESDGSGLVNRRTVYTYDGNGRPSNEWVYLADGSPPVEKTSRVRPDGTRIVEAGSTVEIWDADDNPVELNVYYEDGSLKDKFVFSYDAGRRVRSTRYGADGTPVLETIYAYDEAGHLIETLRLKGVVPQSRTLHKYDAVGNKIEMIKHDASGVVSQIETYDREFDQQGNWITETTTKVKPQSDRTFVVVTRRQIEYY